MANVDPSTTSKRSREAIPAAKSVNQMFASKSANITTIFGRLLQPALLQLRNSSAYAGVAMHIWYNLRVSYRHKATPPIRLSSAALTDYQGWEDAHIERYGHVSNVMAILEDAQKNGVPLLTTSLKLTVDSYEKLDLVSPGAPDRMKQVLQNWSIVAILHLFKDYSPSGEVPYMGRGGLVNKSTNDGINQIITVVILGSYEDPSLFNADEDASEPLWIYQNSDMNGVTGKSSLGDGINITRHGVLFEAYVAKVYPANLFISEANDAQAVKDSRTPTFQNLTRRLSKLDAKPTTLLL